MTKEEKGDQEEKGLRKKEGQGRMSDKEKRGTRNTDDNEDKVTMYSVNDTFTKVRVVL